MRMSDGRCKIIALQLGEAHLNLIRPNEVPIQAKVALLTEEGQPCGFFQKNNDWSEKTIEALRALAEAIEEDCIAHIFEGEAAVPSPDAVAEKEDGPRQF